MGEFVNRHWEQKQFLKIQNYMKGYTCSSCVKNNAEENIYI